MLGFPAAQSGLSRAGLRCLICGENMRRRNPRRRRIQCELPDDCLAHLAEHVEYHGSSEHKSYPSRAGPPALRTDATPCDPDIDWVDISNALAEGVRRGCISEATEQGFPKYVWAWLCGDLYEARHLNGFAGNYKGYRLEPPEYPRDSDHRLDWPPP